MALTRGDAGSARWRKLVGRFFWRFSRSPAALDRLLRDGYVHSRIDRLWKTV
jgi:hypothetical protein